MKNYVKTHIHTDLSNGTTNIDSVTKYYQYIKRAKECGMKAIAFTEHGNIFNHVKKRNECKKAGIKYIHAVECYITETTNEKIRDNYHCCLYSKNLEGYKELNLLLSYKNANNRNSNNYYYVPRIKFEDILNTSENIIITTACLGGILNNGSERLKLRYLDFLRNNKDRCFLEIQHHNVKDQIEYNKRLYNYSKEYGIRLIAGTDTHALNDTHIKGRKILQESKNIHFSNEDGWDLTFKTYEELIRCYEVQNSLPKEVVVDAINNTNVLSDMVEEYELDKTPKYPQLYEDPIDTFKEKINKGVIDRKINKYYNYKTEYLPRILEEFEVYKKVNSVNYMLLQEKITTDSKNYGNVQSGYGRGSVNGSIIAYLLGITETDSIKYGLNFYRFMNPDRISMPDIDSDYGDRDREWVMNYIFNMEGVYTSAIITFNTIALKGSIRDVGRVFKKRHPEEFNDKLIDEICEAAETDEESRYREKYKEFFEYVDIVNGTIVSIGSHPAGIVVSPIPLNESIGTCSLKDNPHQVSMIDMKEIDSLNFIKLDILGLDTIGIINETCQLANKERITPSNVDLYDKNVWESIKRDTTSIFQFESSMAHKYLEEILSEESLNKIRKVYQNITEFDLFMFVNAAIRPAGENFRDRATNGICNTTGIKHLDEMLFDTLGYVLLQEQIMQFLTDFCGYSNAESDSVRRAIGKKLGTEDLLPEIKKRFLEYTPKKYNTSLEEANKIIDPFIETVKSASNYGFSKNHNVPYAITGYVAGYLRYYYPLEFICASLNVWTRKKKPEKIASVTDYANKSNIKINSPKFRYSKSDYYIDKDTNSIYKGIESIKYLNKSVAEYLYSLRNNDYKYFVNLLVDLYKKIDSRQLNILIKLNFFEEFGKINKLLNVVRAFDKIYGKKQFKMDNLYIEDILRFANYKTEKIVKDVDILKVLKHIENNTLNEDILVSDRVEALYEFTGSCDLKDDTAHPKECVVIDINTKYTPKVTLYNVKKGITIIVKISKKVFTVNSLELFDTIIVTDMEYKPKKKKIEDRWIDLEEKELHVKTYYKIHRH